MPVRLCSRTVLTAYPPYVNSNYRVGSISNMGFKLVLAALSAVVASVAAYSIGGTSPFLTGTMNAGLRMPAAVSSLGVAPRSYRRQGAASTVMMPIGVPKVAYRVPGAQTADWVDIYNRLYREQYSTHNATQNSSDEASGVWRGCSVCFAALSCSRTPIINKCVTLPRLATRIIFLGQEIDDELANQIIGVMLYLDSEDSTKPIYMYVNCPGGSVIAGLAIYDTMQHIK
eukprot:19796-Heterococcus_DN1.PRE.2